MRYMNFRYENTETGLLLEEAAALNPRFKSLRHVDESTRSDLFIRIAERAENVAMSQARREQEMLSTVDNSASEVSETSLAEDGDEL